MTQLWGKGKLGDVCRVIPGYAFKSSDWQNQGIAVVKIKNIKGDNTVDLTETDYVPESIFVPKLEKFVLKDRDILVAMTGATAGKVGRIRTQSPILLNQRVAKIEPTVADRDFIWSVVSSQEYQEKFFHLADGAAQPNMSGSQIESVEIPLPPLPIQRRIAGILSAYDELIENNQRRINILEEMARSLYREWFVHFRFPGHDKVKVVPSSLGLVPQGWEGRFGDLVTIERDGINPFEFPQDLFEHFSIPAFDNGRQPTTERGETILSGKYCIDSSCILLSKLNPRIPRIWIPAPSSQRRAITSTEFLVLKPRSVATREFIYAKCCSEEFMGQFASLAIGTSTSHQRVKPENLLTIPSTVPDRSIIERFSLVVAPMLLLSQQLRGKIQNLRRTRDLLLPRLLSGQVQITC